MDSEHTRLGNGDPVLDAISREREVEVLIVVVTEAVFDVSGVDVAQPVSSLLFTHLTCDVDRDVEERRLCLETFNQCVLHEFDIFLREVDLTSLDEAT